MIIRDFKEEDLGEVEKIFSTYWTDPEFLEETSRELYKFIDQTKEAKRRNYRFFVAEDRGKVLGIAGMRSAPDHMKVYTKTPDPVEFYISAVKKGHRRKRIGNTLRVRRLEEAVKLGYTEVVLYSPDSHKESWIFHDRHGFKRVGPAVAPDGEPGIIWRKEL